MADHAQHGVVAFGAGAGEEHMGHALRRHIGDCLGQLQRRRVGSLEEQVVVRQLAHLLFCRLHQFFTAIADRHAPQASHAVEDLVPLAVPQMHTLGLGDDARPLLLQLLVVAEGREVMLPAQGLPFTGLRVVDAHVLLRCSTAASCGTKLIRQQTAGTHAPRN
ncbi:hypothetical protein D3C79_873090 [compost metagenome]